MTFSTQSRAELCALTDSLTSSIRWRLRDYQAILKAELEILAGPDAEAQPRLHRFAVLPTLRN
jgi:hypothetical protein